MTDQDPFALPSQVLSTHRGWTLLDTGEASSPTQSALALAFVQLFPASVDALHACWPLPEGVSAHVVLGGEQACLDWGVDEEALGFHAMCAAFSNEDGDGFDVPDDHRCYINLAGIEQAMADDHDDQATRLSALMTMPHEMGHVALFARYTAGRTPLEVFDQDGGEPALGRALEDMEDHAAGSVGAPSKHGASEDVVESFASIVVDQWIEGNKAAREAVDAIAIRPVRAPARIRGM